jgi:hypothetical protein
MTPAQKDARELFRTLGIGFLIALALYIASFSWIQHKRDYKGPWRITFSSDAEGHPSVLIFEKNLGIENVRLTFSEEKISAPNFVHVLVYDRPMTNAPFGEVVFQDPTFLPGTITFNFWNHGVELMPRALVIDQQEIPWQSNTNIVISGPGKFERRPVKKPFIL